MSDQRQELDDAHRERIYRLLSETSPRALPTANFATHEVLAAYQAILTKDLLWAVNELLAYKQNEVHR